jgi:hypothetical protein
VRQALAAKQPRNLKLALAAAALLVLAYAGAAWAWPWSPKRGLGLAAGFLAAGLFLFEMAYPFRRSRARPLRTAKDWIQAHVYLGGLGLLAVLLHAGFRLPHGWFGWALLLLALWATLGGLLGVFLQKWIPAALAEGLRVEALYDRIPGHLEALRAEAEALMEGASDTLDNFYRTHVREPLARLQPSRRFLFDVRGGRDRSMEPFRRMKPFLEEGEREKLDDLMVIYLEKVELDAQYSLQRILRGWLAWTLHAIVGGVLLGLIFVHVLTWMLY